MLILPKNLIESKDLKENEKIFIEVVKKADLKQVFGSLKRKLSSQKFKDLARAGGEYHLSFQ